MIGSILTNKPSKSVTIRGVEVPINWDFRTSIKFTELLEDRDLSKIELIKKGVRLYYGTWADTHSFAEGELEEAIEKMIEFYSYSLAPVNSKNKSSKKQSYSFTYDAEYVYAAFWEQYKIDLSVVEMHWWNFKALFNGLSENTQFGKIIGYRTMDISKLSDEEKKFYREMKSLYKLPTHESEIDEALSNELAEALENGGDIDAILSKKYD